MGDQEDKVAVIKQFKTLTSEILTAGVMNIDNQEFLDIYKAKREHV